MVGGRWARQEGALPRAVWNTYIWVEDADEAAVKAREAGGSVLSEPFEVMDAGRMAVLADPDGILMSAKAHPKRIATRL